MSDKWLIPTTNSQLGNSPVGRTPVTGQPRNPEARVQKRIDREARIIAYRDEKQTQVELHGAGLRKEKTIRLLRDANDVIDEATYLAKGDEMKLDAFGQIIRGYLVTEASIYGFNHNPNFGRL